MRAWVRWLTHAGKYVSPAGLWWAERFEPLVLSAAVLVLSPQGGTLTRSIALLVCDPCGVESVFLYAYPRVRCATRGDRL